MNVVLNYDIEQVIIIIIIFESWARWLAKRIFRTLLKLINTETDNNFSKAFPYETHSHQKCLEINHNIFTFTLLRKRQRHFSTLNIYLESTILNVKVASFHHIDGQNETLFIVQVIIPYLFVFLSQWRRSWYATWFWNQCSFVILSFSAFHPFSVFLFVLFCGHFALSTVVSCPLFLPASPSSPSFNYDHWRGCWTRLVYSLWPIPAPAFTYADYLTSPSVEVWFCFPFCWLWKWRWSRTRFFHLFIILFIVGWTDF